MRKFWPCIVRCSECGGTPDLLEVYVNGDGWVLLEGVCTNCPRDILTEPVHIFELMANAEKRDKEDK